jgi:hypothetical protein
MSEQDEIEYTKLHLTIPVAVNDKLTAIAKELHINKTAALTMAVNEYYKATTGPIDPQRINIKSG